MTGRQNFKFYVLQVHLNLKLILTWPVATILDSTDLDSREMERTKGDKNRVKGKINTFFFYLNKKTQTDQIIES